MAFCLDSLLFPYEKRYRLHLAAGENGASNLAVWVYLAEDIENIPMLKENQLIITTGLFTRNGVTLLKFLSAVIARKESGIILNVGKYLHPEDITKEVQELCAANQFPLYTMPWEVQLTDVMQSLCTELLKHSQKHHQISTAFRNVLMQPEKSENYRTVLEQNGFSPQAEYTCIVVSGTFSHAAIHSLLHLENSYFHVLEYEQVTLLIIAGGSAEHIHAFSENLCRMEELQQHRIGISVRMQGVENLSRLYQQAKHALQAAEIREEPMARYEEIGILALIFDVPDRRLLEQMAEQKLQVFEAYDRKHHACLVDTLFEYLRTGGSLSVTAQRMYTHRNTIGYRMNQIRELCGKALESQEERLDYLTAIYIRKVLEQDK